MDKRCIVFYDSGSGGLNLFERTRKVFPNENYIYFADEKNREIVDHLLQEVTIEKEEEAEEEGTARFAGMTFVVTGSVEHFANRNEIKELIESLGGKVSGSVSAKTDYLINNDTTSNSSKNKKAKELNIPIISEEDFIKMTGKRME